MTATEVPARRSVGRRAVDGQIRGSSMLLVGRVMSMAVSLVVQVLIVRALTVEDYGLFAYAMSVVTVLTTIVTFGLDRGLARFVVVYEEEGRHAALWGTIALQASTIIGLGAVATVAAIAARGWIGEHLVDDPRLATLLAVMVVLAPIQALDGAAAALFASFGESKAIFVRRYVIGPALRLAVVLLVLVGGGGVFGLGAGTVLAGVVGLAFYGRVLTRTMRRRGLLPEAEKSRLPAVEVPFRAIGAFTVPLLLSDAAFVVLNSVDVAVLGRTHGAAAVGAYRSVLPLAHLNQVVMNSFALLAAPLMARVWARGDRSEMGPAYWHTATWVAVLTFPIAAVTVGLSDPVVATLFGERYQGSGTFLAILAAAFYFNACLGFNGVTVKMVGRVGLVAATAGLALVVNVVLAVSLIPAHGALGAAWASALSVAAYNVMKHLALRQATGIPLLGLRYRPVYMTIAGAAAVVVVVSVVDPPLVLAVAVVGLAVAGVAHIGRRELAVDAVFPELRRVPILARWVGAGERS